MTSVQLRKLAKAHLGLTAMWRNENAQCFPPGPKLTFESQCAWYRDVYLADPADHIFLVMADDFPVGMLSVNSVTREIGRVILGDKDYGGRGVMSQALLLARQAFGDGDYWLKVREGNEEAVAFYLKNGFLVLTPLPQGGWTYMGTSREVVPR